MGGKGGEERDEGKESSPQLRIILQVDLEVRTAEIDGAVASSDYVSHRAVS